MKIIKKETLIIVSKGNSQSTFFENLSISAHETNVNRVFERKFLNPYYKILIIRTKTKFSKKANIKSRFSNNFLNSY